ncbi:MAG: DNA translocase FtsK 4TM domain-containing protein [Syntrophomonadaceae bacterium]|nr:DNA translocase FtsK 4TM domain-containing protein [Syntrophomonadaceae bacterium]
MPEVSKKRIKKSRAGIENHNPKNPPVGIKKEVISITLFMLAVFVYISISRFQNMPESTQFIGVLGKYIMKALELVFGNGAVLISFFLLIWSIDMGINKKYWSVRMWGVSLLYLAILLWISLYDIPGGLDSWEAGLKGMGGGYLGGGLALLLGKLVGEIGALIFLCLTFVLAVLMIIDKPMAIIGNMLADLSKFIAAKMVDLFYYTPQTESNSNPVSSSDPLIISNSVEPTVLPETVVDTAKDAQLKLNFITGGEDPDINTSPKRNSVDYQRPPLELLNTVSTDRNVDEKSIKESISILEDTFTSFGIGVRVNQVSCGPAVTRYELTPAPGVKVSRILSLTDDLQMNLAAQGIRIEAPIPGKSAIGIEVPNHKVMSVGLRNLLSSAVFKQLNSPLAIALGEDISGNTVVAKLNEMPHLLIAGSTGSGKSVCINCIIMILLFNATPEELKLVFIDPKMVELAVYNGIPHLMTPVVTDPKKASVVLRWMVTEMEKRYRLFADQGVRDMQRYNQTAKEKLPYIVIIIDELADLMMVAPLEVEDSICRLAQMSRAAGMHLIVATQRPSVDVVTGIIKANIPSRIAFAVSSQVDSRTILDCAGAEKLLGKGDMLFLPVGAAKPFRVQGAYVSDQEIENTVDFIKQQVMETNHDDQAAEIALSLEQMSEDLGDELFWDAVTVFVESKKASVSLLQRRLRIGYSRAARLVDMMEERGLVSELDNNKKREVLIDNEQLEKLYSNHKLC